MTFERFISLRYLLSKEHRALVSIITVISVLGVMLGVGALIVVISVMDGFDNELVSKMMGVFSHIEIRQGWQEEMMDYEQVIAKVSNVPGVVAVAPIITRQAMLQPETGIRAQKQGVQFRGIDPDRESHVTSFVKDVVKGTGSPGWREVVIGSKLSELLGLTVGDDVYALTKLAPTLVYLNPASTTLIQHLYTLIWTQCEPSFSLTREWILYISASRIPTGPGRSKRVLPASLVATI